MVISFKFVKGQHLKTLLLFSLHDERIMAPGIKARGKDKKGKKPWLAALLNFLVWGLGYLYAGRRKAFGTLFVIGFLLSFLISDEMLNFSTFDWIITIVSYLIMSIAFAYDAYETAKEANAESKVRR